MWFSPYSENPLSKEDPFALPDFAMKLKETFDVYIWINGKCFWNQSILQFNDFDHTKFNLDVHKSDAFRLHVIYKLGGVYCDWDFDFVKPIDELLNCHAFVGREDNKQFCNAIFGAEAGSPFIKYQLDQLDKMPNDHRVWGVQLMTQTVVKNPNLPVVLYPQEYFYPYPWDEKDPLKMIPKHNTYLCHRWSKSWWK